VGQWRPVGPVSLIVTVCGGCDIASILNGALKRGAAGEEGAAGHEIQPAIRSGGDGALLRLSEGLNDQGVIIRIPVSSSEACSLTGFHQGEGQ